MYSPYDQQGMIQEKEPLGTYDKNKLLQGAAYAGVGGIGLGAIGITSRIAYSSAYKKGGNFTQWADKFREGSFYKGATNPWESVRYAFPRYGHEAVANGLDKGFYNILKKGRGGYAGFYRNPKGTGLGALQRAEIGRAHV